MSDEIRAEIKAAAKALCHYPSGPSAVNSCCPGIGRCELEAAVAEIARLRADVLCLRLARNDAESLALDALKVAQCRIARQRRVLAKLYQRRHDQNAAIAAARLEGMKEAADLCDELVDHKGGICAIAIRVMIDEEDKKAAIRAAAKEGKP